MNLRDRLGIAWSIVTGHSLDRALTRAMPSPLVQKEVGRLFPRTFTTEATWNLGSRDTTLQSYISEGFGDNAVIYSAIMYKARAICAAPPRAYIGSREEPELAPPDHPLNVLLRQPNPGMSALEWLQLITVYFNLAGEAYILFDREEKTGIEQPPLAMYPLRPDWVSIIPGEAGNSIDGYVYWPAGAPAENALPILPQDMMHVKLPNPGDQYAGMGRGMSPMRSLSKSGDVDNDLTNYLKLFFERGAMTAGMLIFEDELDDDTIQRIKRRWREQYGGSEKWTEVGVLHGGGTYQQLTPTFEQMGFDVIDERNEARMLMPFGVPPILVGAKIGLDRATYSNYEQARQSFWEDTLDPEIKLFEAEYDYFVQASDQAFIRHDRSNAPAFRQDIAAQSESALKLWRMGVPAKDAFAVVGLKVPEYAGNQISYVTLQGTSAVVPAGMATDASDQSQEMTGDQSAEDEPG